MLKIAQIKVYNSKCRIYSGLSIVQGFVHWQLVRLVVVFTFVFVFVFVFEFVFVFVFVFCTIVCIRVARIPGLAASANLSLAA